MKDLNRVQRIGHLGHDPAVKYTERGGARPPLSTLDQIHMYEEVMAFVPQHAVLDQATRRIARLPATPKALEARLDRFALIRITPYGKVDLTGLARRGHAAPHRCDRHRGPVLGDHS